MTPSEKQKAIAVAFVDFYNCARTAPEQAWNKWLLTEEGKRLTAEGTEENLEQTAIECLKEIMRCMVNISDNQNQLNDNQSIMNEKFDRFEGRLKGS